MIYLMVYVEFTNENGAQLSNEKMCKNWLATDTKILTPISVNAYLISGCIAISQKIREANLEHSQI